MSTQLIDQHSALPGRKPLAALATGPILTPYVIEVATMLGFGISPGLAGLISSAIGFGFAYFTRERG